MNKIFLEDCRETLKRDLEYDYVWMSFPEFGELGWEIHHPLEYFLTRNIDIIKHHIFFYALSINTP